MKDIVKDESFTSLTKFPNLKTIYVLGSGPNGLQHYKRIPRDATLIGVNKAIMLHGAPPKPQSHKGIPMWLWLCSGTTLPEQDWFKYHIDLFIKRDFALSDRGNPTVVVGTSPDAEKSLHRKYPGAAYKATHGHHLKKPPAFKLLWPRLRGGASVGAQAVQLAFFFGAKEIILCGIDTSRHLPLFNGMINNIHTETDTKIVSLSKTELDVEVIE